MPLLTTPYLSRVMGVEKIGVYSYSYSIASYFGLFILLGLNNYGNRTIACVRGNKQRLSKTFWGIYCMQLFIGAFVVILYIIYVIFIASNKVIGWIQLIYIISVLLDINWFFFGMELFKLTILRNTFIKILTMIAIFIFVKSSNDLPLYCLIMSLGCVISNLLLWPFIPNYVLKTKIKINDVLIHIKPNIRLFIPVLSISLYKVMDKIMLGSMSDVSQVGFYDNSEKIILIPITLINSLGTVMLPRMSNMMSRKIDKDKIMRIIEISITIAMFLSIPLSFGIMGVAKEFVPLYFGPGYEICIDIYMILLPSCLFLAFANVIRTQYLIPNRLDNIYIISTFLGAMANMIINFITIPSYGAIGAAIGTLTAEIIVCLFQVFCVKNRINIYEYFLEIIPFFICGLIMFITIYDLPVWENIYGLLFKILVGAVIYLVPSIYYLLWLSKRKNKE